jgi:hypothetical protein
MQPYSAKPRVVHYNRLKPYHGDYDNWLDKNAVINDTDVQTSDNEQITVSDNKLAESEIFHNTISACHYHC